MSHHIDKDKAFVKYLLSFYGRGELYAKFFRPGGMKHGTAVYVTGILRRADAAGDVNFEGDSFDRELARDIALLMHDPNATGLEYQEKAKHLFLKYAHKRWHGTGTGRRHLRLV